MSTGGDGLLILAQREYKMLTYRSLQPYKDFEDREVFQLPNYFYREHSLMLWEAIHRYTTCTTLMLECSEKDLGKSVKVLSHPGQSDTDLRETHTHSTDHGY